MEQRDFLRKQMMKKTREQINEKFAGKEIHIIKAVNLLSDLDSITNLMNENASEWKARQPTGDAGEAYNLLEKNAKSMLEEKEKLSEFVEKEMESEFPNFSYLATPILGAKLLATAGSKKRLAFMPASTIQVLGAEKALFAHLRKKAKSPKHGHLFNHPLLQNLPRFKRGTAARIIAGKLSIALKQDYFNGENTSVEVYKELQKKITELDAKVATPKQEQHEKEYDQITADRRKEQFEKENKKKEYRREEQSTSSSTEHKTFTPEERRAFFEKQGMRQPAAPQVRREFGGERRSYEQRGEHTYRPNRNERSFGGYPQRREGSFGNRGPARYGAGRSSGSFGERREGTHWGTGTPRGTSGFSRPRSEGSFGRRSFGGEESEGSSYGEGRNFSHGRSRDYGNRGGRRGGGKPRAGGKKYGFKKNY